MQSYNNYYYSKMKFGVEIETLIKPTGRLVNSFMPYHEKIGHETNLLPDYSQKMVNDFQKFLKDYKNMLDYSQKMLDNYKNTPGYKNLLADFQKLLDYYQSIINYQKLLTQLTPEYYQNMHQNMLDNYQKWTIFNLIEFLDKGSIELYTDEADIRKFNRYMLAWMFNSQSLLNKSDLVFEATDGYRQPSRPSLPGGLNKSPTNKWVITDDCSVEGSITNTTAFNHVINPFSDSIIISMMEIVSPPLTFDGGESALKNVMTEVMPCKDIYIGAKLEYGHNTTTSNHIHLSCIDNNTNLLDNRCNLFKVCIAWWYFEPIFLHMCNIDRRTNGYCKRFKLILEEKLPNIYETVFMNPIQYFTPLVKKGEFSVESIIELFQGRKHNDRYVALNLHNISTIGTIEVRIKHGTTDHTEIFMFAKLLAKFINGVLNKACVSKLNSRVKKSIYNTGKNISGNNYSIEELKDFNRSFDILFDNYVNDDELKKYWRIHVEKINHFQVVNNGGASPSSSPRYIKPPRYIKLFSYGSNSTIQLRERVGRSGAFTVSSGYLIDHVRIFAGYSNRWDGAVASVYPSSGEKVYGSVVYITEEELQRLDAFEGGYQRIRKYVMEKQGNTYKKTLCYIYIKDSNVYSNPPSLSYCKAVSTMLKETDRYHTKKLYIYGVIADKTVKRFGYWSATDGLRLK